MINTLIKIKNAITGEIKFFSGEKLAHEFMRKNTEWIIWSA